MESMTACRQRVESLRRRARAQVHALGVLEKAFAQDAECLRRHDQARCLDELRARVTREVRDVQQIETIASSAFNKATLISGLAKLALGSLAAAALRTQEHPLSIGLKLAVDDFERTAPFGTVVVAVGPGGVPDEVDVIPLSRYARELSRAESEIVAASEACGYRLMTPEVFFRALDELRERVLNGVATLTAASANFILKPADGDSE